jgi:hypothetical protein
MADEFRPATGENIEYKAYARQFEHPGESDEPARRAVLYVVATLTKPDSGWTFALVRQEGEPDVWRFLEDRPAYADENRTYYIACGTSEHEVEKVPRSIKVIAEDPDKPTRVSVVPWD